MNIEKINDITEIQFPKLGWTFHIDPTAFSIGSIEIQWYGILIVTGLILAMLYVMPKMKRFGLDADRAMDVIIGGVIGGIIGARLYYVLLRWDEYKGDIKAIINTRNGGLAIYGGLIGAILVGIIIAKIRKVRLRPMLDIVSPGFFIGQCLGRWGNFVNQECFGSNTDSIFAMTGGRIQQTIIEQTAIGGDMNLNGNAAMMWDMGVHPCFFYESMGCLLGFLFLAFMSKRRKYDGQMFLMYLAWYGTIRFFIEGLRTDSLMAGNLKFSQLVSAVIAVASVIIQLVMLSKYKRDPESCVLYVNTEESKKLLEESILRRSEEEKKSGKKTDKDKKENDAAEDASILGDDDINEDNSTENNKED